MMQKYLETKEEYKDCILFYRLGDFYEMFFEDALTVSRELEITLTGKDCGLEERAPMCGVPYHAVENYLNRLVQKGYKVAIAEQVEDPKKAKGLVKREVIRVVTPGTLLSASALDESKNNYLMCIAYVGQLFGISIVDVTTGDFYVTEVDSLSLLEDEIFKFSPSEIVCNEAFYMSGADLDGLKGRLVFTHSALENWYFDEDTCKKLLTEHFHTETAEELGLQEYQVGLISSGALMQYLYQTQKNEMPHITALKPYRNGGFMILDTSTRRNLELTETLREKQKRGSLLWVLDQTKTAMGARLLRSQIEQPLLDRGKILERQQAVEELFSQYMVREEIREYLNPIYDLERLISRITYMSASPRDLIAFRSSLKMLPHIKEQLKDMKTPLLCQLYEDIDELQDIYQLIDSAIDDNPPLTVREGGIIKDGFHEDVDKYRRSKTEGKLWLSELEAREREATGIKTLKVKFNKVFGYYIEVSNSFKNMVPDTYTRKQTLTNGERFITPELKELEDLILGAEDKLYALEYQLFCTVRDTIAGEVLRIQQTAKAVACLDVLASLASVAQKNRYVKPEINTKGVIDIKGGRHPVVEEMTKNDLFVANDVYLDLQKNRISIITGPNMAGKSTYMRQVALITLMAQIGSFVPADSASISVCDRIFTRVGASDDLASGQSTFMVEMTEVANILRNATKNSLIVLDEIGRGTSTFDGMSIAWAVVEYISDAKQLGAKTLFATHYHELTELEGTLPGVNNYCIAVKEQGDDIVFLRKIVKGGADKSYGIQVAKLAGVPDKVIDRAKVLVEELSDADIASRAREVAQLNATIPASRKRVSRPDEVDSNQLSIFEAVKDDTIISQIKELDLSHMTPIDALNTLYQLQSSVKNRI
ncbi:MAG: DNA mismatch repair protein MutS [Lachnospiraceae bacterium]|nr:DNA mismatch repair protein MutS [Lachnospiraceae bacterium]